MNENQTEAKEGQQKRDREDKRTGGRERMGGNYAVLNRMMVERGGRRMEEG